MKTQRKILHIWLTVSSFIGFLVGWIFLSHTVNPNTKTVAQVGNTTIEMPAIQALPTVIGATTNNTGISNVQFFNVTIAQQAAPIFRTGGS